MPSIRVWISPAYTRTTAEAPPKPLAISMPPDCDVTLRALRAAADVRLERRQVVLLARLEARLLHHLHESRAGAEVGRARARRQAPQQLGAGMGRTAVVQHRAGARGQRRQQDVPH